ncbi:ribosomal protein S8e [Methanococcus vannielii SB]|uniref:Small ribosomal subunit protein eS8 n=1 Tax=Methanococcus vannielii (strain ATCC 35089 / DSM 1224 / JCM 13029 / OCM 148 / SB) TaxID=406327 RepID=RS8E_METVS|nr:30S ribosomal protein S8e [Methanococcus vannielii]A6UQT9.1 RecName: Full=Small ribosomal subunit protein eS8; AltName: Full=30S ribosomal protein S8e [Methanococcus vannielii SB]ABR54861.1 ribosomal protein S8e [Methanococcus vannielii SB]
MAIWQGTSKRKSTGAKLRLVTKKHKREMGRPAVETHISAVIKRKIVRCRGANLKVKLEKTNYANVFDQVNKVCKKVLVTKVIDNKANKHYIRRNVITKGAIIETEMGKAKVTSRPGQDGVVNAVLLSE